MHYEFDPANGLTVYRNNERIARFLWKLDDGITASICSNTESTINNNVLRIELGTYNVYKLYDDEEVANGTGLRRLEYERANLVGRINIEFYGPEIKYGQTPPTVEVEIFADGDYLETINRPVICETVHQFPNGTNVEELILELSKFDKNNKVYVTDVYERNGTVYLHYEKDDDEW